MSFILFLAKAYIVVLLFRFAATQQELTFNPVGRLLTTMTAPLFNVVKLKKGQENKFCIVVIAGLIILSMLLYMLFNRVSPILSIFTVLVNYALFFMMFFIISVFMGSLVNNTLSGAYVTYFFRLGVPWVKLTRTFIPVSSGKIIYPTMLVIFVVFLAAVFLFLVIAEVILNTAAFNPFAILRFSIQQTLLAVSNLFYYATWLIIARALMSWVSPDIRNPIVQLIYSVTEPILAPFRRIVPRIGILDLSAMAAIFALLIAGSLLNKLISMII